MTPTTQPHRRSPPRACRAGFTLIELLVVMALVAGLMGLGIGFLSRTDTNRSAALAAMSGEIRRATNAARSRSLPTEVVLQAGEPGMPSQVWARVLAPVGAWHFEPDEAFLAESLVPQLNAVFEPGRFGFAARLDLGGPNLASPNLNSRDPLMRLAVKGDRFDLSAGFALRMDLFVEGRENTTVVSLGQSLTLRLDRQLVPSVRMVQAGGSGRSGVAALLESPVALPPRTWVRIELVHDLRHLALRLDGREVARVAAPDPIFQRPEDLFEVSPQDAPLVGLIDELEWLAFDRGAPQVLPLEIELLQGPAAVLRFDEQGDPLPPATFAWHDHGSGQDETFRVKAGGVIQGVSQ